MSSRQQEISDSRIFALSLGLLIFRAFSLRPTNKCAGALTLKPTPKDRSVGLLRRKRRPGSACEIGRHRGDSDRLITNSREAPRRCGLPPIKSSNRCAIFMIQ